MAVGQINYLSVSFVFNYILTGFLFNFSKEKKTLGIIEMLGSCVINQVNIIHLHLSVSFITINLTYLTSWQLLPSMNETEKNYPFRC